jgi:hypothetical protein
MAEKSILEQALLQVQTLEEAVKQNAKGILESTMKQELHELLKESEEEAEMDDESMGKPIEDENDMLEQPLPDEESDDDSEDDEPSKGIDSMDDEEVSMDDEEDSMDDEEDSMDDEEDSMDDEESDFGMGDENSMDSDDEDVMDMTGSSDEEVLKVFKSMKPEDGIVVKKDGTDVSLELNDDEYLIKLDEDEEEEMYEEEWGDTEMEDGEETMYEIELDEEDMEDDEETMYEIELDDEDMEGTEMETTEASRTFANDVRKPADQGKKFKSGRPDLNEEVKTLKKQNSEYRKALVLFKEKLNEVAVFNANLAHATRLFTEQSTTKQEKMNILKRFDSVSTMNESKNLFKTIKTELDTKKPVTESVVSKISNSPTTSTSKEVLSESKAYENPQFKRMKDLMSKIK